MRLISALFVAALMVTVPASAEPTPRAMFASLQARETAARKAIDADKPARIVRRDVGRIVAEYEGLVRRFPRSAYSDNALWQAAMLAAECYARHRVDDDRISAVRLLRRLARDYPASSLIARAEPARRRLELPPASASSPGLPPPDATPSGAAADRAAAMVTVSLPAPAPALPTAGSPVVSPAVPSTASHAAARIRAVRRTVLPDVVRIAIELDQEVDYHYERIEGPVRVFLDLAQTEPAADVAAITTFDDQAVKAVRIGPRPHNATRVVLDLEGAGRHSVFTLYNPYRIVVDIDRHAGGPVAAIAPHDSPSIQTPAKVVRAINARRVPPAVAPVTTSLPPVPLPAPEQVTVPADEDVRPAPPVDSPGTLPPAVALPARRAAPDAAPSRAPAAPSAAAANLQGRFSLSRQLGLGIARIVIDPGHGGHDPGAQNRGLNENELVLDVALRLEQLLLKQPGVEVVLTRRTDAFVPLEERTAMANREGADLFLSIHANASRNAQARGIETYFLNFSSNADAEAVAARENSASGRTMHSLPDIVKAITLNNKLDESRDFATLVQRAMVEHLSHTNRNLRDLGVKQAPFVVLIGAGMPSVLAEISFVTHAQEGKLLRTGSYRQRIAEALYQGVLHYQRSLKGVTVASTQD
jgi:N-acetylmuramoyl-L-alanine amidase